MSKLDPLKAEVTSIKGVVASAIALLAGLSSKLLDALNSDNLEVEVASLAADLDASKTALAAAVAANPVPEAPADPADPADPAA